MTATETHRVSVVVDRSRFPTLGSFVEWGIDMQLADVCDMLRLPMYDVGLDAGHNFAATTSLVNIIAGASVWFFEASEEGLENRRDRSRRYCDVLTGYWPWEGEVVDADQGTSVLYEHIRNPMAHAFGMPGLESGTLISLRKDPLPVEQITELDLSETRPGWLGPTITPSPTGAPGRAYFLNVPALYWGVQRVLRGLLTDEQQLPAAEKLAHAMVLFLTAPNAPWRQGAPGRDDLAGRSASAG